MNQIMYRKSKDQSVTEPMSAFPEVRLPDSIPAGLNNTRIKRETDEYDDVEEEQDESLKSTKKGKAKKDDDDEYKCDVSAQEADEEEDEDSAASVKKPVGARSSRLKISDLISPKEDEED